MQKKTKMLKTKKKKSSQFLTEFKSEKGITLISVVVTIIVLIILSGVAIKLSIDDDGVIKSAEETVNEWQDATKAEKQGLKNLVDAYKKATSNDGGINWDKVVADLPGKYTEYLDKARQQGQETETNIGIGTDGQVVNLDLWHYYKTDDGTGMSLGKGETSEGNVGYDKVNLVGGKVQGKMPQYIYIKSENKVYPITLLQCTFQSLNSLLEVPEIPSTVKNIGFGAFWECTSLTGVTIPSNVTSIGESAFFGCTELTDITIPSRVTNIGSAAFSECKRLWNITIPSNVTRIGSDAFYGCNMLKDVYFMNTEAPEFGTQCFYKYGGEYTTFYFKNSAVFDAFTTSHYNSSYGVKSTDYSW